jgi:hypothetical protein
MQNKTFYYSPLAVGYVERMPDGSEQVHDMLKRNAYAYYVAFPYDKIKGVLYESINSCFAEKGLIKRHPKHDGKDTSRDMIIPPIAVFVKINHAHTARPWVEKVKFRISKRYFCTPSLWFWLKFIQHEKALYKWLFLLFFYIETAPAILYTLVILKLYGVKATHHDELKYQTVIVQKISDMPWLKRMLLRTTYPPFALFLAAQMFWALGIKSNLMAAYTRRVDISNYVCRKMFGEDVKHHSPPPPLNDIRWECEYSEREPRYFYRVEAENNLAIDFYHKLFS